MIAAQRRGISAAGMFVIYGDIVDHDVDAMKIVFWRQFLRFEWHAFGKAFVWSRPTPLSIFQPRATTTHLHHPLTYPHHTDYLR